MKEEKRTGKEKTGKEKEGKEKTGKEKEGKEKTGKEKAGKEKTAESRYVHVEHIFPPVFDGASKILILGSFPSVKSREGMFYYHHPQNRFWRVVAGLCKETVPETAEEKKQMLLRNKIALWDVIESCDIIGSSDSSIRNVIPADLNRVLSEADILQIFGNGQTACRLYEKYCQKTVGRKVIPLPSTSPANAACSFERLLTRWQPVKICLTESLLSL